MINIGLNHIEAMRAHGERDYPHECCGLLIGRFLETGRKAVLKSTPSVYLNDEDIRHTSSH
jgi:proteasome lid subunit RPN8/RPN11